MRAGLQKFDHWLDDRTGYRDLLRDVLFENIPGGARWRYVWGSTLVFTFTVQVITGMFLWMAYSPSAQTAWESVYFIQHEMRGGWALRGVHHFTAQAMIVLLVLHLMQVVVDGAYRAPREVNFWLGLILMQIVLALSLTGYLLPWDQKGYWATRVATELMGIVPFVGDDLQRLVVGGPEYGHHTLTRFFALHAGVLPTLLVMFLGLHVYVFRKHGICHKRPHRGPETAFWPEQVLKDAVACLAVLAVILGLVLWGGLSMSSGRPELHPSHFGAELGAPADSSNQYSAARPEWYFLFLFQLLKYFPGEAEWVGALLVPGLVMLLLFLMPVVGRWRLGHGFNVGFLLVLLLGVGALTGLAYRDDHYGPDSQQYLKAVADAEAEAERAVELAKAPAGIPATGAVGLMRSDPKTAGGREFESRCATCHGAEEGWKDGEPQGAPKLEGFATREWIAGLLDPKRVGGPDYFGNTAHNKGEMVGFVTEELTEWQKEEIENVVMALSAEARLKSQARMDQEDRARIAAGVKLLKDDSRCAQCHKFHDGGSLGSAPDLTGYGSREWMKEFVSNPEHERFYPPDEEGKPTNDRMPAFGRQLQPRTIDLIVDFLRREWYEPIAADPSP